MFEPLGVGILLGVVYWVAERVIFGMKHN